MTSTSAQWRARLDSFTTLATGNTASEYLRRSVVYPNVVDLAGALDGQRVLDAGCGPGWFHQHVECGDAHQCDLDTPPPVDGVSSTIQELTRLGYRTAVFDTVVSCLVLCYFDDLMAPFAEFARVTKPGGRLVICVPHPRFYGTGVVADDGRIIVERTIEPALRIDDLYIGGTLGPFTYFGHPTATYLNTAIGAGWQVAEVRDGYVDTTEFAGRFPGERPRPAIVPLFWFAAFTRAS